MFNLCSTDPTELRGQTAINSSLKVVILTGQGVVKIFHPRNATVNQMYSVPQESDQRQRSPVTGTPHVERNCYYGGKRNEKSPNSAKENATKHVLQSLS